VQIDQVSKEIAESIGLGKAVGAMVRGVETGSPAEKAGVEAGDIITKFDGKTIDKSSDLPRIVGSTKPGSRSTVTVFRRGALRDLTVTVAEIEADKTANKVPVKEEKPKGSAAGQLFGLAVSDLTDAQKKELVVKGGVRVEAAVESAARAGLREGDVILQIANSEVFGLKDFDVALGKHDKSKALNVLFRRGEWTQYALVRPSK
jgi:serine protease Do